MKVGYIYLDSNSVSQMQCNLNSLYCSDRAVFGYLDILLTVLCHVLLVSISPHIGLDATIPTSSHELTIPNDVSDYLFEHVSKLNYCCQLFYFIVIEVLTASSKACISEVN